MRFIDLFAGLGGFHVALTRLGHNCVFASEINPQLQQLYADNFGLEPFGDIRSIPASAIPVHDILCAGFPCQPFSKAGAQQGFDCPRWGDLFGEIVRIIDHHHPAYFLLENVGNIRRHDHGRTWRSMLERLREIGYSVDYASRSPKDVGVPHSRERVFIVGARAGLPGIIWPDRLGKQESILSFLETNPSDARPLEGDKIQTLEAWQNFLDSYPADQDLPSFPIWTAEFGATYPFEGITPRELGDASLRKYRGSFGIPLDGLEGDDIWSALPAYARSTDPSFPKWKERFIRMNREFYSRNRRILDAWIPQISCLPPSHQKLEWNCKGGDRDIWKYLIQFRASGVRIKRPTSAPTLVAINATQIPLVAWERRYLTVREGAALQGLGGLKSLPTPANRAFRALGNAVNADLVESIAASLLANAAPLPVRQPTHSRTKPAQTSLRKSAEIGDGMTGRSDRINIRPPVSVLSVLRHLNYQPWYALAEFVDNAVQSFVSNKAAIAKVDGSRAKLKVSIAIDPADDGRIVIRDNAGGIRESDYPRAFRAAEVPPDRTGLSEFGMGMKSAACWFAPRWSVRTSALGESVERTVTFDIASIVRDSLEELEVRNVAARRDSHYTEIVLSQVFRLPKTKTLTKIHDHLASIYRVFIRDGTLELTIDGKPLEYISPKVLHTPPFKTPTGKSISWKKDIDIDLGGKRRIRGFAALREKGSTIDSGFALFRRKRVIQGSSDDGYRPKSIFGQSNTFIYQRLFGELHLTGFEVSHTKDGFRWDEYEDEFLEELKKQLDAKPLPLLQQALGYRAKLTKEELAPSAEKALELTAEDLQDDAVDTLENLQWVDAEIKPPESFRKANKNDVVEHSLTIERHGSRWEILLQVSYDESMGDWFEVYQRETVRGTRSIGVRLSAAHPFTQRFIGKDHELEIMMKIAAAFALAETTAREVGVKKAGTVRVHFNELLRETFAHA